MKLLAIRLSALGDVVHTIPAVVALRETAEVSWVVEAPYAELVEIVAGVPAIAVRLKKWSPGRIAAARRAIRGFEVAVDFQGNIKSGLVARASGAQQRVGFGFEAVREKPAAVFYTRHVHVDRTRHVVDWNLQLAEAVTRNRQFVTANWSAFPADRSGRLAPFRDRIVLLPGAGRAHKQWPPERFRKIVDRHRDRTVIVWGPGERELAEQIGGEIAPQTNLRELAYVLKNARIVIGGDTGPLHLAAALGTRVVGLYGPTDPRRNGPYGQLDSCIDHYRTTRTMESISVDDVMRKLEEVLG